MEHRQGIEHGIFRRIAASSTAFVMCFSVSLVGKPAHADTPSPNLHNDKVQEFVSRIEGRWGITVSPADYEVATIEGITVIRPKDARLQAQETQDNNGDTKFLMSTTADTPPAPASGGSMADSQTDWRQPTCWARLENFWAWMDMCSQWGLMTYAGETRRNYAYKMYASCGITDIDRYRELTSCYVDTEQAPNTSPAWVWNDWSPRSTINLGNCSDYTLAVSYAGFGAEHTVHTCEELNPEKGEAGADFRTTWNGDAYNNEVREVALLIAIGHDPAFAAPQLHLRWGFVTSECNPIGGILDPCG